MLPAKMQNTGKKKNAPSAFARALERVNARRQAAQPIHIGFIVDATGSREQTWEQAQRVQFRMFKSLGRLRSLWVRLIHFHGGIAILHGWRSDPKEIAAEMAEVNCLSGLTNIVPSLRSFVDENFFKMAHVVILIGDCFEEKREEVEQVAALLAEKKIPVYCFLEGDDWTAETVFKRIAEVTGGKFARFGDDLPLGDLCEGVALLTAGGEKGLKRLKNKRAKQLLLTGPTKI